MVWFSIVGEPRRGNMIIEENTVTNTQSRKDGIMSTTWDIVYRIGKDNSISPLRGLSQVFHAILL